MRLLTWIFRFALFMVMLGFALSNTDSVTLKFFGIPEFSWRAPLVLFLLVFFAAGALFGIVATLPAVFRQRRQVGLLRREVVRLTEASTSAGSAAGASASAVGAAGSAVGAGVSAVGPSASGASASAAAAAASAAGGESVAGLPAVVPSTGPSGGARGR